MIILQDSIQLQQNQEIKISDAISYLNTNSEQPFSDRPVFRPEILPGRDFKDKVTGVPAVCSISGTRYGIVNGAVTQFAVNQPPIEDTGLRGCPAFTQLAKMSETLPNASWAKSNILTPVLSGSLNGQNVWFLAENTTPSVYHTFNQSVAYAGAADNSVLGFCICAKSTNRKLSITILTKANTYLASRINLQTGVVESQAADVSLSCTAASDGFWRIFVASSILAGGTTPYIYAELHNGASTQYTGDGVSGVFFSQPTLINFGVNGVPFIPPYVPNNTSGSISVVSEAATSTTGSSFDLDNALLTRLKTALRGPNAQGHLELTFKSNVDSGFLPAGVNTTMSILSADNNVAPILLFLRKEIGGLLRFTSYDGTLSSTVYIATLTVGQTFKISLDWGTHSTGPKMRITVNGVQSALANFSGSFGTQDLRFFYGNTVHSGWIVKDSLRVMDRPQW